MRSTPEPSQTSQSEKPLPPNTEEEDDFQWELKTIFQLEERKLADPIGRPLPAEWNDDPTIPPAYNAKGIVSEFFNVDNADEFCRSVRDTPHWDQLRFDPSFKARNGMVMRHFQHHEHAIPGYPTPLRENGILGNAGKTDVLDAFGQTKSGAPEPASEDTHEMSSPGAAQQAASATDKEVSSSSVEKPASPSGDKSISNIEVTTTLIKDVPPDVRDDWSPRIRAMKIAYGHNIEPGNDSDLSKQQTEPVIASKQLDQAARHDAHNYPGPLGKRDRSPSYPDERDTKRHRPREDGYSRDRPHSRGHGSTKATFDYRSGRNSSPHNFGARHDSGYHSAQSLDRGRPAPGRERPAEHVPSSRSWQPAPSGRSSSGSKSRSRSRRRSRTPVKRHAARSPSVDSRSSSEMDDLEYAMLGMVRPEDEEEEEEEQRPKKGTKKTLVSSKTLKLEAAKRRPQKVASAFR